ncbi:MAG TPA: cyclic nucleotide-binding domain-containing protein, partial [Candidatus Omnitrophota bacterium]|nr:cyclic nucleotide-binding domain-containing protein [Candidatus Omnitrophota bacterium]
FFGTANKLLVRVAVRADEGPAGETAKFVVFDFRRVTGIDSSAAMSFAKLRQFAEKRGLMLLFAHVPGDVGLLLSQAGFAGAEGATWRMVPDLDHALEWCEDSMLDALAAERGEVPGFVAEFRQHVSDQGQTARLLAYFQRLEVPADAVLIHQGDPADDLFILESGRVTVWIVGEGGERVRLRTMLAGTVVGEMGLYLNDVRSASVSTDEACVAYRLTAEALTRMQQDDPDVAAAFHALMARRLAERLRHTDQMVKVLTD